MIPMRTSTVFKSRWMALLWAGGIIWAALDYTSGGDSSAPAPKKAHPSHPTHLTDASGRPISAEDLQELSGAADNTM